MKLQKEQQKFEVAMASVSSVWEITDRHTYGQL